MQSILEIMHGEPLWDDHVLRKLASYSDWFVPVQPDSCAVLWTIDGVCHWAAQSQKSVPAEGEFDWLEMRGRHLLTHLPDEVQRVVFDWGKPTSYAIDGNALDRLRNIAAALDCEDALSVPGMKGGVDALVSHNWLVVCANEIPSVEEHMGLNGVFAFTAVDALGHYLEEKPYSSDFVVREITGSDLFAQLEARADWDCLWINPHCDPDWYPMSPGEIYQLTQHREPRAEGRILKARTIAEIYRFLDENGISQEERTHAIEYLEGEMVARYTGVKIGRTYNVSYNFYPVTESGSDLDWGSGTTEIICTGLLSDILRRRLTLIETLPRPLTESDFKYVRIAKLWARELLKTLDDGGDILPRRTQRNVDGARFVREVPEIATRAFMEQALQTCDSILEGEQLA